MNHLAHLFLSGSDPDLMLGNFIADAVKGKQLELHKPGVTAGIKLHRAIDTYTDAHPVVRQSKARLYANYSKFAGVITDMYFDHFLALNWQQYHPQPLAGFVHDFYELVQERWDELPLKVQHFTPYMMQHNWLLNYAKIEGIGRALKGLSQRVKHAENLQFAAQDLAENFDVFLSDFNLFFPDLQRFVQDYLASLPVTEKDLPR